MSHSSGLRGEFTGKVALVTGAAQGIGEAVVHALAGRGAAVAAADRSAAVHDTASAVTEKFRHDPAGGSATAYRLDVTDARAVAETVERVEAELGPVDLLVNVAGILRTGPVAEMTDEDWSQVLAVNTTGVFHVSRAVTATMTARGSGSVVTVASNAAGVPRAGMAAYAASKAAAVMFTKCLGLEVAPHGVRCNVVCPGSTDTPMQRSLWEAPEAEHRVIAGDLASYRTGIPLGRIADPADVADAVVFLASDQARHITMQDLYVDGGATLR
ncbi:2,3-dihydro-2,3-dihydroxybenzoate dehydrogenase [Streptomyces solincola]|uniref:2,3-dihydro-2,3-dihydroxybenzoate dehydrogenase n=1 Tax=Streptomyces solincola TaxID=2100817 RepID=A0A2S9PW06_9ACTN|nr:2,3-dihydro-2,3-dihydroxybenzoate dehydrogenase [Streptomyces solincola]PRH78606.1 2,3-dihydro-2,3-dihydroxybenzoate dehydrogenase [Streptomyces solincola]